MLYDVWNFWNYLKNKQFLILCNYIQIKKGYCFTNNNIIILSIAKDYWKESTSCKPN